MVRNSTFSARVVEERVPLMQEYGHEPTGLYEVVNNLQEVVMIWATSIAAQKRLRQNRDTARGLTDEGESDERLVAWERSMAGEVISGDAHVMTPLPKTVYGPEDWEEADLSEWLAE